MTFDADVENWAITYSEPEGLMTDSQIAHNAAEGDPAAGCLEVTVPYTAAEQKLFVSYTPATPLNMTGTTITAMVQLAAGLTTDPSAPGGAKLYVKTGDDYVWADGGWNNLETAGAWLLITLDVSNPSGYIASTDYDPSDVRELGIEFDTNTTAALDYSTATIYIDTVEY
jgi:hypothetical protein